MNSPAAPASLSKLRIGVDLDNTIVCYDGLFHALAREQDLIPADLPVNKTDVRDFLRKAGKEDLWTQMQAEGYGPRMNGANAFPGVLDFFVRCRELDVTVFIVSHKTKRPYMGPPYDLHESALQWLNSAGFFDANRIGMSRENVFLELSKQAKIDRIAALDCTHFIDDLPEFLAEASFCPTTTRILFDPGNLYSSEKRFGRIGSWLEIWNAINLAQDAQA